MGRFARCKCFLDSNVYVKNIGHLVFKNEAQFIADYGDAGPATITNFNNVLHEVLVRLLIVFRYYDSFNYGTKIFSNQAQVEVERRKNIPKEAFLRTKFIQTNYTPLHPEIYHLKVYTLPFTTTSILVTIIFALGGIFASKFLVLEQTFKSKFYL